MNTIFCNCRTEKVSQALEKKCSVCTVLVSFAAVFRLVLWEERCVTSLKTAVKESSTVCIVCVLG